MTPLERIGKLGLKTVKFDTGSGGQAFWRGCEIAGVMSQLTRLELAWVMVAYINTSSEKELEYMSLCIVPELVKRFEFEALMASKIVKMACRERMQRKELSNRMRSVVLGVPKSTYARHQDKYDDALKFINNIIDRIEESSSSKLATAML